MGKTGSVGEVDAAVGARVRLRRQQLGFSQAELGKSLGMSFQQVQKYERGVNRMSASVLVRTAEILRTSVAALIGEAEPRAIDARTLRELTTPGAVDLLAAFGSIDDEDIRVRLLELALSLAKSQRRQADALSAAKAAVDA